MKFPKREGSGNSEGGNGPFLRIKDGEQVTGILRGKTYQFYQSGFGAASKVVGPGEGKERFRHNFIVKEGDQYVAKIWEFGPKIYDALSALEASGWELETTLLTISRVGSTKENTRYTVTPQKKEPTPAAMKEIDKLTLNVLEHREPTTQAPLRNYAPGSDDSEVPF
jgi:hypothetical protein